jgi:hypothetical protein
MGLALWDPGNRIVGSAPSSGPVHASCRSARTRFALDDSFCVHELEMTEVLVVSDMTRDGRFEANPTVAGDIEICFCAGASFITPDGYTLRRLLDALAKEICVFEAGPLQSIRVSRGVPVRCHVSVRRTRRCSRGLCFLCSRRVA